MEKDGRTLVMWKTHYGAAKILALEPGSFVHRLPSARVRNSNELPPAASADLPALVRHDSDEPRLESAPFPKISKPLPGTERRLLKGVFGL